ncbi:MAG: adenylate/guanylate cyclase domain-containing protein [Planctomycetota bacterium]
MSAAPSPVRFTFNTGSGDETVLVNKTRVVLGRSPTQADVTIKEEKISRTHAQVVHENGAWFVEDLGSANGTRVNSNPERVTKAQLASGDVIWLGEMSVRFDIERSRTGSAQQRVVFSEDAAQKNKTAAFNMSELGLMSETSDVFAANNNDKAAAWAVSLFTEAAQVILSSSSLDDMFEKILDLVFQNLPAERGVVALLNEQGEIVPRVTRSRDGKEGSDPIRISHSIATEAIQSHTAFRVGHALSDDRFGVEESIINLNIQSAMCAPMFAPRGDRGVVGIIYVDFVSRLKPFSEDDLRLLSALAAFAAVAVEQRRLLDEIRFEQDCRSKLSKYHAPQVVERIIANTMAKTGLDGMKGLEQGMMAEQCEVSILFADLSGFTAMSEFLGALEVAAILNEIFDRMTKCIFEAGGTLDKFMGDAVMAFFGAPLRQTDHAERAVRAGLAMQKALQELNADRPEGQNEIRMRIGINSGTVVAGDIGSPDRKDYTVIGDTVNVASRLESTVAKPGQVVIGPMTYEQVQGKFTCTPLEPIPLKGKTQTVQPYLAVDRS